MKPLLLLSVLALATGAQAVPTRKRIVWEYATLDLNASRRVGYQEYKYGAEIFLPAGKVVFLEAKNRDTPAYKTYLLNRLGAQGWELVAVTGYQGSEGRYIFKRQK